MGNFSALAAMRDAPRRARSGPSALTVRALKSTRDVEEAQQLLREYRQWLLRRRDVTNFADSILRVGLRGLDHEIRLLPRTVRRGRSVYFVARRKGMPVGCVALRPLGRSAGELTRLYVRSLYRQHGVGRRLTLAVVQRARRLGYGRVVLDSLPTMGAAIALYRRLGFLPRRPYWRNPVPGALFFERRLSNSPGLRPDEREPATSGRDHSSGPSNTGGPTPR
jgi:ribosomal protein S18 acetylase RimI-like enzyme